MDYADKQLLAIISIPAFILIVIGVQIVIQRVKRHAKARSEQAQPADADHEHHAHPA